MSFQLKRSFTRYPSTTGDTRGLLGNPNVFLVVLLSFAAISLRGVNVSGYVADAETGETIIGVNVIVEGTDEGASTDMNGFFIVRDLPRGTVHLRYSHIAYKESREVVKIGTDDVFVGTVRLAPTAVEGEAIEVVANRGNIIKKDMDIASFEVDPVVLREAPQLGKDIFKLVKFSPSVTISDAFSPLYNVRGSDPSENLVQLDGMTIYNPQHLVSGKAIFNPFAIKNIEMLVGGFDAELGGRNASILYITTREGHKEDVHGEFKPSTSGIVGAVEFPAGGGATAMLSGRLSVDLVSRVVIGMPNLLADFNAAYQRRMGNTRLRLSAFLARDLLDFDAARYIVYFDMPELKDYSNGWLTNTSSSAVGVQTRSVLMPTLVLESQVYASGFHVDNHTFITFTQRDTASKVNLTMNYDTRIENRISDLTVKASLAYFAFSNQTLKVGFEYNAYRFFNRAGVLSAAGVTSRNRADLQALYLQDKIEAGPLLVKIGLRNSRFNPQGQWRQEPRASLALRLGNVTMKAAWGIYYQYLTSMNTQDFELTQAVDYYYPLQNMEPLGSVHNIVGLEGKLGARIDYSITGYVKDLRRLYRYDYTNTSRSILSYQASLEKGRGDAYGAELLLRGEEGPLSGWMAYSYSVAQRSYPSIQEGEKYMFDGDQTHSLKTLLMYRVTRDVTTSATVQITSGFPKTWETGLVSHYSYDPLSNTFAVYPEYLTPVKNNVRFPPRILLDVGWKKKLRSGFGYYLAEYLGADEAYFTLTIRNVLFLSRNPYMYIYLPHYGYYGLGNLMPPSVSAGYSIKF